MSREMRIVTHEQYKGSVYTYSVDLSILDQGLGLTSSAVTWSTEASNISIGSATLSSSVASAPITASSQGEALIKLTITTNGNDTPVYFFRIVVMDPENYPSSTWR